MELNSESRRILGPAGNRVKVKEDEKEILKKKDVVETKSKNLVKLSKRSPQIVVKKNDESVNSSCSSKSSSYSSNGSSVKIAKRREKHDGKRLNEAQMMSLTIPFKRCDWITQFSDPLYVSFHDEEWGVPVHEDGKLFELLVLSQASAELTWPEILYKREKLRLRIVQLVARERSQTLFDYIWTAINTFFYRKLFENFNPSSVAKFPEDRLLSARQNGSMLLSEQKLRAIVVNAIAFLKIQQEFGSFRSYCWRFLNNKPIKNNFRYARKVPAKTPKSELISKDLMQRGFRCVGPTVVYSFMQISGMVNDHLISCFRHIECNGFVKMDLKPVAKETKQETINLDVTNLSHK